MSKLNLEELYMKIVEANVIPPQNSNKSTTSVPTVPNVPSVPSVPNTTTPQQNVNKPNKENDSNNQDQKDPNKEEENKETVTNKPLEANKPPEANKIASIISKAIENTVQKYAEATIYYMNPKVKKAILDRIDNKPVVIRFAGSNDHFPAVIDNDTYDHYVKGGMEAVYVPLTTNEKFFTFNVKNINNTASNKIYNLMKTIQASGYINEFEVVKHANQLDVTCSLDEYHEVKQLPELITEGMIDVDDIVLELPDLNCLCMIPESIVRNSKAAIKTLRR